MADIIKMLNEKERKIRDIQRQKAKQEGQRDQLMKQLREEFGVDSIEQAAEELGKLKTEEQENDRKLAEIDRELGEIIEKATTGDSNTGHI